MKKVIKVFDHCRARTRRANDRFGIGVFKDLDKTFGKLLCFTAISGIECRLSAASLALVENNVTIQTPQHFDHAHPDVWADLVDETSDENRDFHDCYLFSHRHLMNRFSISVYRRPASTSAGEDREKYS